MPKDNKGNCNPHTSTSIKRNVFAGLGQLRMDHSTCATCRKHIVRLSARRNLPPGQWNVPK